MLLSRKCVRLNNAALVFLVIVNHIHLCQDYLAVVLHHTIELPVLFLIIAFILF